MTRAQRRYRRALLRMQLARAELLLRLAAAEDRDFAGLLAFSRELGLLQSADSLRAFRAA